MNFIKTFLAAILAFVVGSFLVFFLWIFILLGIAGSMEKTVAVHAESILKIDFSDVLTDAPSSDPFAGIDFATLRSTRQLPLMKALRSLEAAKDDSRIKGIYLRMNGNGGVMGAALLEELREAVVDFKQSGKFVVAYDETYSQGKYYLASAADKIYMQPEGAMDWSGLAFNLMFYKGLLDKLEIKAEVFRPTACKYKSAVEPYILPKMSDANREQMQALVNSMWNTIAGSVAEARGIDLKELNRITDKLEVSLPEDALEHGFVDSLIYEDQMKDIFAELGVASDSDGEYNFITLGEYASQVGADLKNISADQVAVVYFIPLSDYNAQSGESRTLDAGEVLVYASRTPYEEETFSMLGQHFKVADHLDTFMDFGFSSAGLTDSYFVIVSDMQVVEQLDEAQRAAYGTNASAIEWYAAFDTDGTTQQNEQLAASLSASLQQLDQPVLLESRSENYAYLQEMYGGFLFIGVFLSILFLMVTILILYYKQISEGYEDKERFEIMQKVGMDHREVKKVIRSQVLTVFFLPLIAAGIHIVFAFPMVEKLLLLLNLTNTSLFVCCTLICFAVFAFIYVLIYFMTSRIYYGIVRVQSDPQS